MEASGTSGSATTITHHQHFNATPTSTANNNNSSIKINFSAPASPATASTAPPTPATPTSTTTRNNSRTNRNTPSSHVEATFVPFRAASSFGTFSPAISNHFTTAASCSARDALTYATPVASSTIPSSLSSSVLSTPKKSILDAIMMQTLREKINLPGGVYELHTMRLQYYTEPVSVIKERYLITNIQTNQNSAAHAAKTPASYRHLVDLSASNLKCTDIFTGEQFLCKIINEPLHKVQKAYFLLQQDSERCHSNIYGHLLIRGAHDIVPLSKQRTYVIIAPPQEKMPPPPPTPGQQRQAASSCNMLPDQTEAVTYEDLHTYIRNKRRLCEREARALFHQICQTVQVCHSNGIILRDLKLKRFYFIDGARTKLQYESLEGSMILDDTADDTLSDKIGCPLYTAPELLCPKPTYQGKPADVWSLGVILYTMLVGQYPFYEKGNCNLIAIIRHCQVQIPYCLSRPVRHFLLSLLRKNYKQRLPTELIFYAPWMKQQQPYYMNIPADVVLSDDEDDDSAANGNKIDIDGLLADEESEGSFVKTLKGTQAEAEPQPSADDAGGAVAVAVASSVIVEDVEMG